MFTLQRGKHHAVAHSLRGEGFDASEDGTGRGTPLVPVTVGTMKSCAESGGWSNSADHAAAGYMIPVAFDMRGREGGAMPEGPHDTANIRAASGGSSRSYIAGSAVRRLTPRECERLQGFPDDFTLVTYRGKPAADGPRYKALGNSMAVPVVEWIGRRLLAAHLLFEPRHDRCENVLNGGAAMTDRPHIPAAPPQPVPRRSGALAQRRIEGDAGMFAEVGAA